MTEWIRKDDRRIKKNILEARIAAAIYTNSTYVPVENCIGLSKVMFTLTGS